MSQAGGLILPPSISKLPGWDTAWKAALANVASAPARGVLIGDSLTFGFGASNTRTKSWAALLTAALQAKYGDGGSGIRSPSNSAPWLNLYAVAAGAVTAYEANNSIVLPVGAWTTFTANVPFECALKTVDAATPASYTETVRGTTVNHYTLGNGGANATARIDIDGGGGALTRNITDTAVGLTPIINTFPGLAAGNHTVKTTYTDAGVKILYYGGVEGLNPGSGVVIDNLGAYGILASQVAATGAFGDGSIQADWLGGSKHPASLIIIMLGANDAHAIATGDLYAKYMRQIITRIKDSGQGNAIPTVNAATSGNVSVLMMLPHIGAFDGNSAVSPVFHDYAVRARAVAPSLGASLIDFWLDGNTSWNNWNNQGFWCNVAALGTAGTDYVHPSDAGYAHMYSLIQQLVS
jgi:lysophospholipase L1-like esterase